MTVTTTTDDVIAKAILYLDERCDGAHDKDGAGFNGRDTQFGKSLAKGIRDFGRLTDGQRPYAWRMIQTYRKQLLAGGIHLPDPNQGMPLRGAEVQIIASPRIPQPPRTTPVNANAEKSQTNGFIGRNDSGFTFRVEKGVNFRDDLDLFKLTIPDKFRRWDGEHFIWHVSGAFPGAVERLKRAFPNYQLAKALESPPLPTSATFPPVGASLLDGRTLRDYQVAGAQMMKQWACEGHGCIVADEMGLGKTLMSLVAARELGYKIVVVGPVTLRDNWFNELAAIGVPIEYYSWAKVPEPFDVPYVVLADEAHAMQSMKSARTQKALALSLHPNCRAFFPITGTPLKNGRPANLFPLLKAIRCPVANDQRYYELRYCGAKATQFSKWDVTGHANLEELNRLTAPYILRRFKKDCLSLPEKTRVFRAAEVSKTAQAAYKVKFDQLRADYRARLSRGEISDRGAAIVLLNHLRHAGSIAKVEDAIQLALEVIDQGGQIVLFTEFRTSGIMISNALGCEFLNGDTPQSERQPMVDRFQSGQHKAFVGTIRAGGIGLNITAGTTVILVDRPWTPGEALQAEDRLHRDGQKNAVTALWLRYGAIDDKIDPVLQSKAENIGTVLEGKAGSIDFVQLASEIFGG